MQHSIRVRKIRTVAGKIKAGPNPVGFNKPHPKTTPGSPGTNHPTVVAKKRASALLRGLNGRRTR